MNKKTVWLTGGGTGIGKDLTKLLCDNGFDVIISGRRKDKLIEVAKYNKKKIFPYKLDVSNLKETDIVAKKIIKKFKFIDLLVLNAAIYSPGSLKEISPINAKKVIDINLTGIINCLPTIVNAMKRKQKGHVIFVSSPKRIQRYARSWVIRSNKIRLNFFSRNFEDRTRTIQYKSTSSSSRFY